MVLFELAGSGNFGSDRCTPPEDDKPSTFHVAPKAAEGTEECGIAVPGPDSDGKGLAEDCGIDCCTPPEDDKPSNFHVAPKAAEGYEDCGSDGKGLAEDCGIAVRGPGSEGKSGKDELAVILGGVHAAEEVFGFLVGVPSSSGGRLICVPSSGSGRVAVTGSVQPGKGLCLPPCPRGKGLPAAGSLPPTAGASLRIARCRRLPAWVRARAGRFVCTKRCNGVRGAGGVGGRSAST